MDSASKNFNITTLSVKVVVLNGEEKRIANLSNRKEKQNKLKENTN